MKFAARALSPAIVVLACLVYGSPASAQVPFAAIKGTVTDPSEAVLTEATITIRDMQTGAQRVALTGQDGTYQVERLDPAEYEIEVSHPGFSTAMYGVTLQAGEYLTFNFQLEVGRVSETVIVDGQASGVNASDFQVKNSVTRLQIDELPLNGRNFLELARLEPNVSVTSVANPGAFGNNYQRVSVAGAQYLETRVAVDGSTVDDRINGGTALNVSQESVQEFQISTFNFDLSTGATGSGAVNIITRRGGNALHGSSFFYYRDHSLAAYPGLRRDPANPRPFFARRQSGLSIGGPLVRTRFFGFTNIEHNDQDGVFAVTNNNPIFSKLDVVQPSPLNFNLLTLRLDANIGSRHTGFLRGNFDVNNSIAPSATTVSMPSNWFTARTHAGQIQAGLTSVMTPRFVSDLRLSYGFLNNTLEALTAEECPAPAACVGIGGPDILVFDAPSFRMGHHVSVPKTMQTRSAQFVGNLTWQRGTHRLRFGAELEHVILNSVQAFYDLPQITLWGPTNLQGVPSLQPLYDALPATLRDPSAGPPTASDILQLPLRSFLIGIGNPLQPGPYHHDEAHEPNLVRMYFEDGWTIRPRLTLSYGLAYLQRMHIYNQDLQRPAYLAPILSGNLRPPYRGMINLEPTAGLAWSVRKAGSTVLRAGAGIYHDEVDFFRPFLERGPLGPAGNGRVMVDGSVAGLSFTSTPTGFQGGDILPLLPGIRSMLMSRLGDGSNAAIKGIEVLKQGDRIFDPNTTTPSAIHVNAGIRQMLSPHLILAADYVARRFEHFGGFHGVFQLDRNRFNRPRVTGVNSNTGEVSFVRAPVIPLCSPAQAAALIPADQCSTGPINVYGSGANYFYQGLHLTLEGRVGSRLHLTAAYALGHNTGFVEFNNYDNYRTAYGDQPDDRRHRLTLSAIYDLPKSNKGSRRLQALLNGWTVAMISETDSAPPLETILTGLDLDGDGISRTLLPGVTRHNTLGRTLNPAGLRSLVNDYNAGIEGQTRRVTNPDGSVSVIRPRTPFNQIISPITLPDRFSNGDTFITQDVRLTRKINITETYKLALMGEAFNFFNIANMSGYSNTLNQMNYGLPSARAGQVFGSGGPRAIQFATRLEF
jgi:hypothetical protein